MSSLTYTATSHLQTNAHCFCSVYNIYIYLLLCLFELWVYNFVYYSSYVSLYAAIDQVAYNNKWLVLFSYCVYGHMDIHDHDFEHNMGTFN